jgi:hypothetical protein
MLRNHPVWLRITGALYAVVFYALLYSSRPWPLHGLAGAQKLLFLPQYLLMLFSGLFFTWLAFGAPVFRRSSSGRANKVPDKKLPIWLRITSALYAVLFFVCTPFSLYMALCAISNGGPGGPSNLPYTIWNVVGGLVCLLVPLSGLFFTWLALGAPVFLRSSSRKTDRVQDDYHGPRCVACREPVPSGADTCPKCGWTQPK